MVTNINEFKKEVFNPGTGLAEILTHAIFNGIEKTEQVIKDTYTKNDACRIINGLNLYFKSL